ncbi:hypothetical protein [Pseudomonas hormoni]
MKKKPDTLKDGREVLEDPPSPGSALKIVGLLVTGVAIVFWLFSSSSSSSPPPPSLPAPTVSGPAAADTVISLTKQMTASDGQVNYAEQIDQPIGLKSSQPTTSNPWTMLDGVKVAFVSPSGWTSEKSGRQLFLRKSEDARVCQIVADSKFDPEPFRAEVLDNEVEYESQMMSELLEQGGQGLMSAQVTAKLVDKETTETEYHYVVETMADFTLGTKSLKKKGVNATWIKDSQMVRLQCMNMNGNDDEGAEMSVIGLSLKIVGL